MYIIILSQKVEKFLGKLQNKDKKNFGIIINHLNNLKEYPKSYGKPLQNVLAGLWSYRVGNFRIIYEIKENELIVYVVEIGHRRNIYDI